MTEAERVKPRALYVEEAIQLALESRWADAVTVNRRMLDQHGPDEEAYNRLGKALTETGELSEALECYRKTLEMNPLNLIAPKMIKKISALLETPAKVEASNTAIDVDLFTEEPGKSGLTVLVPPSGGVTEAVVPGDVVELDLTDSSIRARTVRGVPLGEVDPKLTRRLAPLMESGNRYSAAVARVDEGRIEVMIREVFQAPENARKTSFPIARGPRPQDFRPYAKDSLLLTREPDLDLGEDEDDDGVSGRGAGGDDADELEGLQQVEGDLDDSLVDTYEDSADDDGSRPEDSY